jgi:hypothetical protein
VRRERHRKYAGYGGCLMGWSLPEIPDKEPAQPWVCLLIIVLGIFTGLVVTVLTSPAAGLPSLSSGYGLPLTARTFTCISAAIAVYSFWWEMQATRVWNWNEWCRGMRLMWCRRAHQNIVILRYKEAGSGNMQGVMKSFDRSTFDEKFVITHPFTENPLANQNYDIHMPDGRFCLV